MAAVSHDVEHTAPSSTFPDQIDCVKFITKSKAKNEKKLHDDYHILKFRNGGLHEHTDFENIKKF